MFKKEMIYICYHVKPKIGDWIRNWIQHSVVKYYSLSFSQNMYTHIFQSIKTVLVSTIVLHIKKSSSALFAEVSILKKQIGWLKLLC
jgi:hypothetical protein